MAARQGQTQSAKQSKAITSNGTKTHPVNGPSKQEVAAAHLPPLPLVLLVLICSGSLLVFAIRDLLSTGRNIAGTWDEAMLTFTKSKDWFDTSKGWKSTQGGFSAIQQITTDKNNMGGFFVRKMAGAAAVAIHLQKMLPLLFHPLGAQWVGGHFRPLLWTALVGNVSIVSFYALYMSDLAAAGAASLPKGFMALLTMETLAIMVYLFTSRKTQRGPATAMKEGKTPSSPVSRIVARTVLLVSSAMVLIAGRDLFFPGFIFEFFPRDDIYLEWTNSFIHSPPEGSPEAADQGLEAPLYIGDKFMSQYLALHLLLLCLYKYVSSFIRLNADGSGEIRAKMIWKGQAIGDALLLFVMRLFTSAAVTASLNLRWHVMCLAYETFILGLYGYF